MINAVIMPAARMTIDHGRVGTLKRREMFSRLSAVIVNKDHVFIELPNKALLSPRRIQRIADDSTIGITPSDAMGIADSIFEMMNEWSQNNYPMIASTIVEVYTHGNYGIALRYSI